MLSGDSTYRVLLGIAAFIVMFSFSGQSGENLIPVKSDQVMASDNGLPPPLPPQPPPPPDPTLA